LEHDVSRGRGAAVHPKGPGGQPGNGSTAQRPGRWQGRRPAAAASGLRHGMCRGKGPAQHGRMGRPDLQRWVHPHRRRCRRKAGGIGNPGTARPCPAGFAGPGPAWQRPGGRRSHGHR
jgi:hypothetical protein